MARLLEIAAGEEGQLQQATREAYAALRELDSQFIKEHPELPKLPDSERQAIRQLWEQQPEYKERWLAWRRLVDRLYRLRHSEQCNLVARQSYQKRIDDCRAYAKSYYLTHQEQKKEYDEVWRREHPEALKSYREKYCRNHLELVRERAKKYKHSHELTLTLSRRRRAKLAEVEGNFSQEDFKTLCRDFDYKCAYCSEEVPLVPDHMAPLVRGGSNYIDNIIPACKSCNSSKGDKSVEEFIKYLEVNQ